MKRLISFFTRLCEAYLPDAFVFCLLLTLIVFIAAWVVTPHSGLALLDFWGKDFWGLNGFAMQMIFILISGHMLATTPLVGRTLKRIGTLATTETRALILMSTFSMFACWLNWGFGLIASGVLALEFARRLKKVNLGLLAATAYSGFVVWHGGLSGSIPLKVAGKDEVMSKVFPELSIPLSETIFSTQNLLIVLSLFLTMPLFALWMRNEERVEVNPPLETEAREVQGSTWRDRIENSRGVNTLFFLFFAVVIVQGLLKGETLDINRVNFIFLSFALILHGTPRRFLKSLQDSFGYASGIAIQFPFYAGLMGLMQYSGLGDEMSLLFVKLANQTTLPLFTFLSAGLVNFFIPSGGGQWVVQGPIMLKAAKELGVDPAKVAMALAWGDAWTNLIQPFWVLPILSLAGLKLKDVMGYCLIFTFCSGAVIATVLLFPGSF